MTEVNEDQDWKEELPEEYKGNKVFEPHKLAEGEELVAVPPSLLKSHVEQQKLLGKDKITLPGENATPEEWSEFYGKIGRPDAPIDYELPEIELPEGAPQGPDLSEGFKTTAHEIGLTGTQATKLYEWYQNETKSFFEEVQTTADSQMKEAEKDLKNEWHNDYEENVKLADRVFHTLFPNEEDQEVMRILVGNNPRIIKAFHAMSKIIGEDHLVEGKVETEGEVTKEELQEMMKDPRYWKTGAKDQDYINKITKLFEKLYPGETVV